MKSTPYISASSRQRAGSRSLATGLLTLSLMASTATAQTQEVASVEGRAAQFVFVIDDSGSMSKEMQGYPAADPNRLATFAVQALVEMLDDQDEVSLVRLNGPRQGRQPPAIEPLSKNRSHILGLLDEGAELASYAGELTPCRSALASTRERLEQAHRPGVPQVVMLLTDGGCTPQDTEVPDPRAFLRGLSSHEEGLFQFYLLRFEGRPFTPQLQQLAELSGGQSIEVSNAEPAQLLEPFADALSRSQGYEAELLSPGANELAAHRGAKRVRLLAVAPDPGPPLSFRITDAQGRRPRPLEQLRQGEHQYLDGRIYRYAALDYQPGTEPVAVEVEGAGDQWKVVALPEYRLFARMELYRGNCDEPAEVLRFGTTPGTTVCAIVELVNERGRPVSGDVTGGNIEATMRYRNMDETGNAHEYNAVQLGSEARYGFQRADLPKGDHQFQGLLSLQLAGQERHLKLHAGSRTLQASSVQIEAQPATVDFGTVQPGQQSAGTEVRLHGNFPPTEGTLDVVQRGELLSCLTFSLSGKGEGESQPITEGQSYRLGLQVASYCGPESFEQGFEVLLRLVFEPSQEKYLPEVTIPASLQLVYRVEAPEAIELEITAGEDREVPVPVTIEHQGRLVLGAQLEPEEQRTAWPSSHLNLSVHSASRGMNLPTGAEAAEAVLVSDAAGGAQAPLTLRLTSTACCDAGEYTAHLALSPVDAAAYAASGKPLEKILIPVRVRVNSAGAFGIHCWGLWALRLLLLLLLLLLIAYLVSMFRHSAWLQPEALADKLVPLLWTDFGTAERNTKARQDVLTMVRRGLPPSRRVINWLKANPLIFGLPGRRYQETVEVWLEPERSVNRSRISLLPARQLARELEQQPEAAQRRQGRLFASAQPGGGLDFFGVPMRGYYIGRLVPERYEHEIDPYQENSELEPSTPRLLRLRRREKLIHALPSSERETGQGAGWQVG